MQTKHCKHCRTEHPLTPEYWYKNGGILRKCKVFYTLYEQRRGKKRPIYTQKHALELRQLQSHLAPITQCILNIKIRSLRIDMILPDLRIAVEFKPTAHTENASRGHQQRRRIQRVLPDYTAYLVSDRNGSDYKTFEFIQLVKSLAKNST